MSIGRLPAAGLALPAAAADFLSLASYFFRLGRLGLRSISDFLAIEPDRDPWRRPGTASAISQDSGRARPMDSRRENTLSIGALVVACRKQEGAWLVRPA